MGLQGLFGQISTCTFGCTFRRTGEWFDFGSEGGGSGFSGDPVGAFETDPITFAFGIPFPITLSLSLETQSVADTQAALSEAFADFGATLGWSNPTTQAGYTHWSADLLRGQAELVDGMFKEGSK